jgi:hypothetical protein
LLYSKSLFVGKLVTVFCTSVVVEREYEGRVRIANQRKAKYKNTLSQGQENKPVNGKENRSKREDNGRGYLLFSKAKSRKKERGFFFSHADTICPKACLWDLKGVIMLYILLKEMQVLRKFRVDDIQTSVRSTPQWVEPPPVYL